MALITRLARLWRADINALLDRLEAPDLVLAQSVREMEQALDSDRRAHARLQGEIERLAGRTAACTETLAQTESALDDCLAEDRDDLARALIRRRLETEGEAGRLSRHHGELSEEARRLGQRIGQRESQLADLRARAALHADPDPRSTVPETAPIHPAVGDDEVEIQLLQAKRRRGGAA
jgi:phage shock protein A